MKFSTILQVLAAFLAGTSISAVASDQNPLAMPQVGHYCLRALSPTLLELEMITTKDPDPAAVTSWNFVDANYILQAPPASSFAVSANGNGIAVRAVNFKRRPLYAPLKVRDLRIGNYLYLTLAAPLANGQTVTVKNPAGDLWTDATVNYTCVVDPFRYSPAIHVNQVGYLPTASKMGFVGFYLGSAGETPVAATSFSLIDANTKQAVFSGSLVNRKDVGYTYTPTPYQQVYEADFTAFQTPGRYLLQVPGMGVSFPFVIGEQAASIFARTYALGLYHQRCGTSNALPYTRFEHGICHAAPAEVPTMASTFVNDQLASMSSDYANNPLHTAPQLKDVDSSLYPFVNAGPVDVSRGHHDAGDYSKYTINSAALIHHLVFAADAFAGVAQLDNLGLPESGDGKSDILQEAKWEADFLSKMQDADGGFYFLVYPQQRAYENDVLPDHGDPQVVFPKTTAVTAAAVGALAEIASSPAFKQQFPTEAASYLAKATKGWTFLMNAIAKYGKNGAYQKITHYGNEFMHDDELAWAAAAMFVATGNTAYQQQLIAWYDPSDPNTRRWTWWRLFEGYGCAARAYAFAARSGRLSATQLDPTYLAKCQTEIIAAGDDIERFATETAYGTSFPDPNKSFRNAGWYFSTERAFELATAYQLNPAQKYLTAIESNVSYEAGCNPVNVSYITGLGAKRQREIVHQYAQNDDRVLPPDGFPLGNIQAGFSYLDNYKQELGELCFPPDGSDIAPYPFYDRWGDSFNTTTEFVVVDQARALAVQAFRLARSTQARVASANFVGTVSGIPSIVPAGQFIDATFSVPGVDLSQATLIWEATDQEPFAGATYHFAAKNPGDQWIEVQALLQDGSRAYGRTTFSASISLDVPPNTFQSAPVQAGSQTVGLYHLDSDTADAAGKLAPLTLAGQAKLDALNLAWMATRSGQALHFLDLGDKATVQIPQSLLYQSGVTTEIAIEGMIYVEAYKGYNRGAAKILTLDRDWNASLELMEDTYTGAHVRGGTQFDFYGAALQAALTTKQWHHLSIRINTTGYSFYVDGQLTASVASNELANWANGPATVEIGNFDGWLDEVTVRNAPLTVNVTTPPPSAPKGLTAQVLSSSSVQLAWSDTSTNENGFRIYTSLDDINFVQQADTTANVTTFKASGLAPNTLYYFAVKAFNGSGESAEAVVSARTLPLPPAAPSGVTATVQGSAISIAWNASVTATSYSVKRATIASGPFTVIANGLAATSYLDGSAVAGTPYYYVVTASNAGGESANSATVTATVPLPTTAVAASFLGVNTTRQGSWKGKIGSQGYNVIGDGQSIPSYATLAPGGKSDWVWTSSTSDNRALQKVKGGSRIAAAWYSGATFNVDINLKDGQAHRVSFYLLDWDKAGRSQQVDVLDTATGKVLQSYSLSSFGNGVYLEYKLQGKVTLRLTRSAGPNCVVSGIFFDAP